MAHLIHATEQLPKSPYTEAYGGERRKKNESICPTAVASYRRGRHIDKACIHILSTFEIAQATNRRIERVGT